MRGLEVEAQDMVDVVDYLQAIDVGARGEEQEDQVALGYLAGIDGETAVVAQVIDVGGLAGCVLDEEAVAVARDTQIGRAHV